jgi:hypothetical protein
LAFSIQALTLDLGSVSAKAVPHEIKWSNSSTKGMWVRFSFIMEVVLHQQSSKMRRVRRLLEVRGRLTPDAATREAMAFRHVSSGVGKYWMHTCDRGV